MTDRSDSAIAVPIVPVVHAVTDDEIVAQPGFARAAEAVMRTLGPRGAVHLRAHALCARDLFALAERLVATQESSGCWLVVNERIDVARAVGARAAQLTRRSVLAADARRIAPGLALGVSVHTARGAIAAATFGANWVVAGHVHATPSHPGEPGRGDGLVIAAGAAGVPVIAIGGVLPAHIRALRDAGAHGVAAIRGVWGRGDAGVAERASAAAAEYLASYDEYDGVDRRAGDGQR